MAEIPLDHQIKSAVAAWREKDYEGRAVEDLVPPG